MALRPHLPLRVLRATLGFALLLLFSGMVALWTVFGFLPHLAQNFPEPFTAFGRVGAFWPILAGFFAGGGAAWCLAPGMTIHGAEEGESHVSLSPLAAALLGPSSLLLMFAAYWPCSGVENPVWGSLRRALEALEGFPAEPFGVVSGCPAEFPQGLLAGILFGKTTLVLVIGIGFAYVFGRSIDAMRARFASQVVVLAGVDSDSTDAARSIRKNLTRRQRLILLDVGPGLLRARELAREIDAIVLPIDVGDGDAVRAFMQARGRRGIQGLHLLSPDAGLNVRAMGDFLYWQNRLAIAAPKGRALLFRERQVGVDTRAATQRRLLEQQASSRVWRASRNDSGLGSHGLLRSEVPGRVVVRIDNPWHAEDWRQRQMIDQAGWLFDAVSTNEIAARHLVRQAKEERIEQLVLVGSSPFELAVISEIAFEHRVDRVLADAAALGKKRLGDKARDYQPDTPVLLLHGEESRAAAEHFQRQLLRFGITTADRHIRVEEGTVDETMARTEAKRALVLHHDSGYDATFLAVRHPRWRIFDWVPDARGLTSEPMIGKLSMLGPTLEPVHKSGVDIWERLARIKHEIYLYNWYGGTPVAGDPNRGDWDGDLDEFARESNVRSFSTFCRSIAAMGRGWATDLGEGGEQLEYPLVPYEITQLAVAEHNSWVRHHVEYGWRLGDARSINGTSERAKLKRHPDIVEWGALSAEDQQKDLDNIASTIALMKSLGFLLVDRAVRSP